jgi:hypothetical protein
MFPIILGDIMMDDEDTDPEIIEDLVAYALRLVSQAKFKVQDNYFLSEDLESAEISLENFLSKLEILKK